MNFKHWLILTEKIMIKDQEFRDPLLALQQIRKTHPNPENLAVTFTRIDKVGLNPKNKWKTPLGIYLYPIDYVIEKKMNVPFAGDQPYLNVCEFTRPQKILHMTSDVSSQKGMELLNVFPKEQVDQASESVGNYDLRSNYSKLWLVTKAIANDKPTQWNINLRKCGIDGFMDHGTGTIHINEPTQCVVFAADNLKLIHSIDNPRYYKTTDKFGVDKYNIRKDKYEIKKMSDEQIIGLLQSRRTLDITNLLQDATDKGKRAELIIKYKKELSDDNIKDLLDSVTDKEKDKIAELIIKYKTEITDYNFRVLLGNTDDRDKIIKLIINKLSKIDIENGVRDLINYAKDKDKIAEYIIEKQPELSDDNIFHLLYHATKKDEIAELIIKNKPELSDWNVTKLLGFAINFDKIAERLQEKTDNISKLSYDNVSSLIKYATDKKQKQMAQIINKYHQNKTPEIQKEIDKYLQPQTIAAK